VSASFEAALRDGLTRLPGLAAQLTMAPRPRAGWNPERWPEGLRHAAALVLLYPAAGDWHLPLTVRAGALRRHTGQVSLPGGGLDTGESVEFAALREAQEEIGVVPGCVRVLGRLTSLHIPVSGYLLHPVLGIADARPDFRPDPREVERVLEVPLGTLQHPATRGREQRTITDGGRAIGVDVPYFSIGNAHVWGATAMVLAEFLALVGPSLRS
jgi:8-oxo-dGTP pyrophosphatase MutT (NUDIX family)